MISIDNITKSFDDRVILDDVSLSFTEGEVTAIVGPSGAGKSTLLRSIDMLERPDSGSITVGNLTVEAARASKKEILELRRRTAMVFQQFNLLSRKTALENVAEGPIVVQRENKQAALKQAAELLDRVGLAEHSHKYPTQLSGGQQQRVGIARALAMKPEILLLDEPTSALDPELVGGVLTTIQEIAREGQTMVIVSHEMNFVRQVAQRVVFLENGRLLEDASPEKFFSVRANERTRAFLHDYHLAQGTPEYQI